MRSPEGSGRGGAGLGRKGRLWLSREGVLGQRREGGKVVPSAVGAGLTTIKGTVRVCGSQSVALGIGQGLLEMPWAQ